MNLVNIRTNWLSAIAAAVLAALLVLSDSVFGAVSPPSPQVDGNAGYQKLWAGDPAGAVAAFQRALEADPAFPYHWSDLGEALNDAGRTEEARYCFRRAVELAPESPEIALRTSNFYFRSGEVDEAISLDSKILSRTDSFDPMIFGTWRRMGVGIARSLDAGIGTNPRVAEAFFDFLAGSGSRPDQAGPDEAEAWRWLESRGYATTRQSREWVDSLLRFGAPAEAADVWARHVAVNPAEYRKTNWIDNAGFESDWSNGGFDWNSIPCPGVKASLDSTIAHSGSRSLRLDVRSEDNLDFHHFSQRTWMSPGRYRVQGWIRTGGFTTDQGIGLRAWDPGHPSELSVFTPAVSGTSEWKLVAQDFTVAGHPRLIEIQVVRRPSWNFDNHPRGAAWIDDIRVLPLP